jgi:predicted phosphoribosyltransferase
MTEGGAAGSLREVRLLGFPLKLHQRATEHHEELMREFQLLALDESKDVPRRLVELIDELTATYSSASSAADAVRDAALERGEESVDLTYVVPAAAAEACERLERMLDEADEFCRSDQLLTMAAPDDAVAFRRWYLSEFPAQIAGAAPTPWPGESAA